MKLIQDNIKDITALCVKHNVKQLYGFGSVTNENFTDASDVDLLVQFNKIELKDYFNNYMDFKEELEKIFVRQVDLVENQSIKNPIFRKSVDKTKKVIYG